MIEEGLLDSDLGEEVESERPQAIFPDLDIV